MTTVIAQPAEAAATPIVVVAEAVPKTTATTAAKPQQQQPGLNTPLTDDVLSFALVIGLIAAGASSMARKKWPDQPVLACEVCVSTWASAAATILWWAASALPVVKLTLMFFGSVFLVGTVICLVTLKAVMALTRLSTP